ncbi:Cytochrome P450 monooxygenase [Fusarium oxysporum f. sp. rapae]|uniref:Cytochrome P450 monooxygenase n=1 Tax=Fusarium oxysporum f. sp. rapae TaxID=485398 RepID=A0A8J5TQ91_FUSOX|nr:Cytochrome P450 monooxygenase [Fusarium oxysporum f. sp. rapae]
MILERLVPQSLSTAVLWLIGVILTRLVYNKYGHGLNHVPGPLLAGFTDIWRLFVVRGRRAQEVHIELHKKYGPAVRLGPRAVSIADTDALKVIYSPSAGWSKSKFYPVQQALAKGKRLETMFNTDNDRYHARLRRSVSNSYAMSTLVTFEPFVDSTSAEFIRQLKLRFAHRTGNADKLFIKNPIKIWLVKYGFLNSSAPVAEFARKHLVERQQEEASGETKVPRRDFLNRFKEAHNKDPGFITEQLVLALTVANMFAGSDTTGITLRAVFYYLLKDPPKMESLLKELAAESKAGRFSRDDGLVQWEEVRDLPYLSAVINEALRCHPAVGLTLERIVPPTGVTLAGHYIPGGSIVGCSPWVIHQDTDIYGADAAKFRPERWIEATPEQRKKMTSCLLSFGAGARTCVGKNISLLELYKLVPTILRIFEVRFLCPFSCVSVYEN